MGADRAQSHCGHRPVAAFTAARQGIQTIVGRETLSRVSTWPDEIRSDPERFKHTAAWHFIDIPDGETVFTARRSPHGDALSALERMERDVALAFGKSRARSGTP